MCIPVGKSVGIVGMSGAGKSTTADIILGLLRFQKGKVLADGVDVSDLYGEWLSCVEYIPQMIFMLDDSIRSNVAFGVPKEKIDDGRVWEVLGKAQLASFVRGLPEGLDTQIGEHGVRLSGGQRQRISVARALYPDLDLLIFDEATSALDKETEAALIGSVKYLHGKKQWSLLHIAWRRLRCVILCIAWREDRYPRHRGEYDLYGIYGGVIFFDLVNRIYIFL